MKSVTIIGLGLMGASIAKALKKHGDYKVIGYDLDASICDRALCEGVVDFCWNGKERLDSDITLLCISPSGVDRFLRTSVHLLKKGSIVSDVCGIKERLVTRSEELCSTYGIMFVGGHPMAGRERSGYGQSVESLFINRSYILTVTEHTDAKALDIMKTIAYDIGCCDVTVTTPEEHDRMIAFTSQLPHVLAGAYIKSPQSDNHKGFSAGSYHDVSRVASVDENLWSELFLENWENLIFEIDLLIENLREYKTAIANNDFEAVNLAIKQGRILKERDININGNEKPHEFG